MTIVFSMLTAIPICRQQKTTDRLNKNNFHSSVIEKIHKWILGIRFQVLRISVQLTYAVQYLSEPDNFFYNHWHTFSGRQLSKPYLLKG